MFKSYYLNWQFGGLGVEISIKYSFRFGTNSRLINKIQLLKRNVFYKEHKCMKLCHTSKTKTNDQLKKKNKIIKRTLQRQTKTWRKIKSLRIETNLYSLLLFAFYKPLGVELSCRYLPKSRLKDFELTTFKKKSSSPSPSSPSPPLTCAVASWKLLSLLCVWSVDHFLPFF